MNNLGYWLVPVFIFVFGVSASGAEDPPAPQARTVMAAAIPSPAQVELRLNSVKLLIESSSAARQVDNSGIQSAIQLRGQARDLYVQAVAAFKTGDTAKSAALLDQASRRMFQSVRLAAPDGVTNHKKRADFTSRLDTVSSLLTALKRIGIEKKADRQVDETITNINAIVDEAKRTFGDDIDGARVQLDKAYLAAKLAVEKMRQGDTLVRSLKFNSQGEEYRYELDRNDTHQMLVKLLTREKLKSENQDNALAKSVDEATRLRKSAEDLAGRGDYDSAIRMLEQSTSELVRAIRIAGVYIPG